MKKIKGSLSAIRMSHLVALFVIAVIGSLVTRTYQLLAIVNPTNGFYENADFTVPLLNAILIVGTCLFLIMSFLSKNVPAPKLPEGRNIPLGMASFIAVIAFVWDIIIIGRDVLPDIGSGMNQVVFDGLVTNYIKANGGIFVILELIFAVLSVFYFLVFGMSHFEGKATYKKISLLSIAPGCWAMFVLISKLMKAVSFITVSELLFEIGALVFTMIFFLTFARIVSGVFTVNSMWCTYGCGFTAAIFMGIISIPRGIVLAVGRETVEDSDFSFTHLFLFVFIIVYIISTLGVGFKNALKKMRSVSNIVLPDDDEVVVKGSDQGFQATENEEAGVKKRGFTVAPEFKNIEDIGNLFDDDFEADTEIFTQTDNEEFEKTNELRVFEDIRTFDVVEENDEPDDLLQDIPDSDASSYDKENPVIDIADENTVAEAAEIYEKNIEEEIDENSDEDNSHIDDIYSAQEGSEDSRDESVEEIEEIPSFTDGENSCEENTEEITQESAEEVIEPEDEDYYFELTDAFSEKSLTEEVSEKISEEIDEYSISSEEMVEETLINEEPQIVEETIEKVEQIEETQEASLGSTGGFLDFSQMLIDDYDEEEDLSENSREAEIESSAVVDDFAESEAADENAKPKKKKKEKVKKEKVKKEKVKKEKVKKEKVKKEKTPKPSKVFGKKKNVSEDDEPVTIVSLADLKQKKDKE